MRLVIDCRMRFGVGTVIRGVVPYLAQELDELTLLGDPAELKEWAPPNAKIVPFTEPIYGWREQTRFPARALRGSDLLHVPHINVPLRALHIPMVVTINDVAHLAGVLPINRVYRAAAWFYYEEAARRGKHIITLSEFSKGEIIKRLRVPEEKITVIPCGVDSDHFYPRSEEIFRELKTRLGIEQPYLIVLGSVRPHKNVGRVIEAFARLKPELPHKLVIVGQREGFKIGEDLPHVPAAVEKEIIFTGYVSRSDVAGLYSFADLLIFASIYEGFGLPPLEAMACGAPVAVSRAASLPEVVGDAGVYFDPFDVEDMANVVRGLLGDGKKRRELSANGLMQVKRFDWKGTARQYLAVYRKFAERA